METIKLKGLFILLILFSRVGLSQDNFIYPEIIDLKADNKCSCSDFMIKHLTDSIKKELDSPYKGIIEIRKVDLNFDSKCEIMLIYEDREAYPNYTPFKLFKIDNNTITEIGFFFKEYVSFANKSNDYLQILSRHYEGQKTNPIYYLQVYRFDGKSYKLLETPNLTRGQYMDLGSQSYNLKKYEDAERYYFNAYIMSKAFQINQIIDANNLALVWIKQKKYDKSKSILLETISILKDGYYNKKELAPVYYNLGLIAESKNNYKDALDSYQMSYSYEPSDARMIKINLMKEKINGR